MNRDEDRLAAIVSRLDRLRNVPTDVLAEIVRWHGACLWCYGEGDPPQLTGQDTPDREFAARICAGCPVQDECLELEMRYAGPDTVGVWGALPEQDRRALYPLWRARGHHEVHESGDGGDSS